LLGGVIEKDEFLRRFKNEIVGKAHFSIVDSFADVLYETLQLQVSNHFLFLRDDDLFFYFFFTLEWEY